jgi:erythromycin esterase-like protein
MRRRYRAMAQASLGRQLEAVAHPLTGIPADYEPLLALIGNARFVLLGEASHGTHEFYRERAEITKRLIQEKGFTAVKPLERTATWEKGEAPETLPSGL